MSSHYTHKPHRVVNNISLYFYSDFAIIVFNRGENRINLEFLETVNILLDDVEKNETCKGLITTGTGKFYGNGLDLEWMATLSKPELVNFVSKFHQLMKRILMFPLPTLAALNGHAYAGGALFAFFHDIRTMRRDKGWLCLNEVFINRRFSEFHLSCLRIKIGTGRNIHDAIVLGRRYTGEEALHAGLVHGIPSESLLIPESVTILKSFCGKSGYPRVGFVNMKEDVYKECLPIFDRELQTIEERVSKL